MQNRTNNQHKIIASYVKMRLGCTPGGEGSRRQMGNRRERQLPTAEAFPEPVRRAAQTGHGGSSFGGGFQGNCS